MGGRLEGGPAEVAEIVAIKHLSAQRVDDLDLLPGLTYLPNGEVIDLGTGQTRCRVGGVGGCHGPSNHERRARDLQSRAQRHFSRDEVERLAACGQLDVLLLHDAPAGVEFAWRRPDGSVRRRYVSEACGLAEAVAAARPIVCFFGHHHTRHDATIADVPCVGLNKVGYPGDLVAFRIHPAQRQYELLGEWPARRDGLVG